MKKVILVLAGLLCLVFSNLQAQKTNPLVVRKSNYDYYIVTTIESVVPMGLGRSRMITTNENGKNEEVKLQNFFSGVGINFGNIRKNDAIIAEKLTQMSESGWELQHISNGVYGADTSTGIFITRYLFRKLKIE